MKIVPILLVVVLADQAVKWWVRVNGWYWVLNKGGAFSIGAGKWWFPWIAVGALMSVIWLFRRDVRSYVSTTAGALLIGGAVSNLVDRVLWGGVVDYITIWRFPVFNLADVGINVGVGLLIFHSIFRSKSQPAKSLDV